MFKPNMAVILVKDRGELKPGPKITKRTFMLNSDEHEILKAHKNENLKKLSVFQAQISLECFFPAHKC